jgi:hypothetical protein
VLNQQSKIAIITIQISRIRAYSCLPSGLESILAALIILQLSFYLRGFLKDNSLKVKILKLCARGLN